MLYFGEPWASPICDEGIRAETPTDAECLFCSEPIAANDCGMLMPAYEGGEVHFAPVHRECSFRNVIGGIEHLTAGPHRVGDCYKGSTLTYRESSLAAWDYLVNQGGKLGQP